MTIADRIIARPLWAGRTAVLIGIILVALNLRTAVSAISPIVTQVRVDIPLNAVALGIIGGVAPAAFALSALFTPVIAKRIGLERLLLLAIIAMVLGHLIRAFAAGFPGLLGGSVLAIIGAGIGNVVLPPLVKRYFPDRVGVVTSIYVVLLAVSATIPAAIAIPVADSAGWRFSLALWSGLAVTSAIPWTVVLLQHRRERRALTAADEAPELPEPEAELVGRIWHSRTAWVIAITLASSTFSVYAVFAWLPELLVQTAGVSPATAGGLLALNSIVGAPSAILLPILTIRIRRVSVLVEIGAGFFVLAYLGLLFFPATATWLWVIFIGLGPMLFPICLTLINLRSRTQRGSVALSGFTQSIGYFIGVFGPILVGVLRSATGGWVAPLILLLAVAVMGAIAGTMISRRTFVEDELIARSLRRSQLPTAQRP
jgi:CP family cyanate transporter-like MFS transporter